MGKQTIDAKYQHTHLHGKFKLAMLIQISYTNLNLFLSKDDACHLLLSEFLDMKNHHHSWENLGQILNLTMVNYRH